MTMKRRTKKRRTKKIRNITKIWSFDTKSKRIEATTTRKTAITTKKECVINKKINDLFFYCLACLMTLGLAPLAKCELNSRSLMHTTNTFQK